MRIAFVGVRVPGHLNPMVGLHIDWTDPLATMSELAWLTQTPKEFDFENPHWPSQLHHTGPFHDGPPDQMEEVEGGEVIFITQTAESFKTITHVFSECGADLWRPIQIAES